jgi:hypothetical protein
VTSYAARTTVSVEKLFDARRRAERVIAGTQTGQYKKLEMARDLVTFTTRLEEAERLLARWEGGQLHSDDLYCSTKEFLGG